MLDQIGFTENFSDALLMSVINPLANLLEVDPPSSLRTLQERLQRRGHAMPQPFLDAHRFFTVDYTEGEQLTRHQDNSEVTLNVGLNQDFEGGDIVFQGWRDMEGEAICQVAHKKGMGILHLGAQVHNASPVITGRRTNLICWTKSSAHRAAYGCALCGKTSLFEESSLEIINNWKLKLK